MRKKLFTIGVVAAFSGPLLVPTAASATPNFKEKLFSIFTDWNKETLILNDSDGNAMETFIKKEFTGESYYVPEAKERAEAEAKRKWDLFEFRNSKHVGWQMKCTLVNKIVEVPIPRTRKPIRVTYLTDCLYRPVPTAENHNQETSS